MRYTAQQAALMDCNPLDLYPLARLTEREKLAVFGVCVPQKAAGVVWNKVQRLLGIFPHSRPFDILQWLYGRHELLPSLQELRIGQYSRVFKALHRLALLDHRWQWDQLEPIVGRKTARMVGLYSWPPPEDIVPLDRHILRYLGAKFPDEDVPTLAPASLKQYQRLERLFIDDAHRLGMKVWELDREVWQAQRQRINSGQSNQDGHRHPATV